MKNQKFKAFVVRDKNKSGIESMNLDELMPGNVLVKVKYSSLNYKDGLAVLNKSPIIRRHPMIPGSDFAGTVIKSDYKRFKKGDKVLIGKWSGTEVTIDNVDYVIVKESDIMGIVS